MRDEKWVVTAYDKKCQLSGPQGIHMEREAQELELSPLRSWLAD
jgi:hypothetical protein